MKNKLRICEVEKETVCDDCDGEALTCLIRLSEDLNLYQALGNLNPQDVKRLDEDGSPR